MLLEKCFYASPDQRPNFEEIKAILVAAYDKLFDNQKESNIEAIGIIEKSINKTMQVQYSTVIQMNKEQKERDYVSRKEHGYLYMKKKSPCSTGEIKKEEDTVKDDCDGGQMHEEEQVKPVNKSDSTTPIPAYNKNEL